MASIAVSIVFAAATNVASSWVQQGPTVSGIFGGVAALSSTTAIITGGINGEEGEGAFLLDTAPAVTHLRTSLNTMRTPMEASARTTYPRNAQASSFPRTAA